MKLRYYWPYLILLVFILVSSPVMASVLYTYNIAVSNNSTAHNMLPIIASINNTALANGGFISSTGLDTRILKGSQIIPHMVADDKVLFVDNITAGSTTQYSYTNGNTPLTSYPIIVGDGGYITIDDDAALEPGILFAAVIDAYLNTASGIDKNIIIKPDVSDYAFKLYISDTSEITASIDDGACDAVATGITSGEYEIMVIIDGVYLKIYIDDVLEDSTTLSGASVPNTSDDWIINQNNVCSYINSLKIYKQ